MAIRAKSICIRAITPDRCGIGFAWIEEGQRDRGDALFGIALPEGSRAADYAFWLFGATIGAAGGVIQAASRTMMCRQANPARMTEAFGLYALAGKATSFLAPLLIGVATTLSDSQRIGVSPIIGLFVIGLILLRWVQPDGDRAE